MSTAYHQPVYDIRDVQIIIKSGESDECRQKRIHFSDTFSLHDCVPILYEHAKVTLKIKIVLH